MTPQLTAQQMDHAIQVWEKRVEAKHQELDSYAKLRDNGQAALRALSHSLPKECAIDDKVTLEMLQSLETVGEAAAQFFAAKHTEGSLVLEEMELQLKAMRQMRSGVVGASMVIPPFNSNRH